MKLIVGLGNPGEKYESTRHNAGFWLLERFAAQTGTAMRKDAKFQALVGRHAASGAWLMMPQGFMNLSGLPVQLLAGFFRINPADILVVHDELDFAPGVVKMKQGGGIAGHNGLRDISARIGSHEYWRLRIGIGHPGDRKAVTDYVLHRPSQEDRAAIENAIARALDVLPLVLGGDLQGAMLKLHTPDLPDNVDTPRGTVAGAVQSAKAVRTAKTAPSRDAARAGAGADNPVPEKPDKPEKEGALKSLLKKFLPDADAGRNK